MKNFWKAAFLFGFGSLPLWVSYFYFRGNLAPGVEWFFIFVALPLTVTAATIALVTLLVHWRTQGTRGRKLRVGRTCKAHHRYAEARPGHSRVYPDGRAI